MYYMPDPVPNSFDHTPATNDEIKEIIHSFKDKPCHVDNIPIFIMKKLAVIISPVICDIYNSSITEGTFPSILKIAKVIPLHKAKRTKLTNNFRPISLLPFLSKLL